VTDGAPGFAVGLGLTNDCNLACAHCYRDTDRVDHLSLSDVRRVADRLPIRAVNLGTGENALHPEFREILRELRARGIVTTLTSNGHSAAVLDDDELGWLRDLELSLDFPTEAEQDVWRGPGNWRLILEQTERAQRLGVAVTIVAVMMRTNYDRLPALARLAIARGRRFASTYISRSRPTPSRSPMTSSGAAFACSSRRRRSPPARSRSSERCSPSARAPAAAARRRCV